MVGEWPCRFSNRLPLAHSIRTLRSSCIQVCLLHADKSDPEMLNVLNSDNIYTYHILYGNETILEHTTHNPHTISYVAGYLNSLSPRDAHTHIYVGEPYLITCHTRGTSLLEPMLFQVTFQATVFGFLAVSLLGVVTARASIDTVIIIRHLNTTLCNITLTVGVNNV